MSGADGLFRRAVELCAELRELAPPERELRLAAACASEPELLALVRTLLAGERAPLTGLDRPAIEHVRVPEFALPERIGRCRIVRVIGRGGQGIVYEAEQDVPRRPVAVKVIGTSWVSASSRRRFEEEVEILGRLEHPSIARIYEGGVVPGPFGDQPYFVMQLGLGKPLTEHADEHGLDLAARVRLLTRICEAVEHAHGKLVVHCDLKPANILVTAAPGGDDPHVGRPLILDFGIAQVLGRAEVELTAGKGTPGFMAPEQRAGERPDVRWDVFALGNIGALLVPSAPARRDRHHRDALAAILGKATERDPGRRYRSVEELRKDLERCLRFEPPEGVATSRARRMALFVRRRPTAAALYAVLALTVLLSAKLVAGSLRAGQRRAALASAVQEDVQKLALLQRTFQWEECKAVLAHTRGRLASAAEAVSTELRAAIDRATANLELAQRLDFIRFHRAPLLGGVPDKDAADRDYETAFLKAGLIVGLDDQAGAAARVRESEVTEALVAALDDWAVATQDERRRAWCLGVARLADPNPTGWRARLCDSEVWADRSALAAAAQGAPLDELPLSLTVAVSERLQDLGGAEDAIRLLKHVDRAHPGDFGVNFRLGFALISQQNPGEAVGYYRAALAVRPVPVVWNNLGYALKAAGELDEAISSYEQALRLDPKYAPAHMNLGVAFKAMGRLDQAIDCYRRAVEADPAFAQAQNNLANALKARGDLAGAVEHFEQAARLAPTLAEPHYNLGLLFTEQERDDEAIAQFEEALRLAPTLYQAHNNLGNLLKQREQWDEAVAHYRRAIELAPGDAYSHANLGRTLMAQGGHPDEALAELREGVRLKPDAGKMHAALGKALLAQSEFREAEASLRRALELLPESDPRRTEVEQNLRECQDRLTDDEPGKARDG